MPAYTKSLLTDFGGSDYFNPDLLILSMKAAGLTITGISANGDTVTISASSALDSVMLATLDQEVTAHRLATSKKIKSGLIDVKTQGFIFSGFPWNGVVVSLSSNAQRRWIGMLLGKDTLPYPIIASNIDDTATFSLASAAEVQNFYGTAMLKVKARLDSGTSLKDQIRAAVDIVTVNAIQDTRYLDALMDVVTA